MILVDQVGQAKLFRGARPTIDDLKQVNFDINLEVGWFEFLHGNAEQEARWCAFTETAYVHKPLSDLFAPSRRDIIFLIKEARFWLFKGKSVLIHCLHGEDRTGIVIAAYRIRYQNWSVENAIKDMYQNGFHQFPYRYPLHWESVLKTIGRT